MMRYKRLLLPAIILVGAALRFFQIGRESLWYDELYTIWSSRLPLDVLLREVPASGHPPLYYLVGHFWFGLGSGEAWFRMISWSAGVLTILLVYLLGKELISRSAGLWGAAFTAFSPFLVWYSRDATDYSWLVAVSSLSIYFLVRSINHGGWINWSLYVLASVAALFSHYYAIVLLMAEFVLYLMIMGPCHRQLKQWLASQGALALVILPWFMAGKSASSYASFHAPAINTLNAILMSPLVFVKGYAGQIGSGAAAMVTNEREKMGLIMLLLFIAGLIVLSKQLRRALMGKTGLALVLCTMILIVVPVVVRAQDTAGRYLALAAPLFMLLLALVISAAPRRIGMVAGAIVLVGLTGLTMSQMLWTHTDDWRGIMSIIAEEKKPGDNILCFPLHNCIVAQSLYPTGDIFLDGGNITPWDHSSVGLQRVVGWDGYLEGYGGEENHPEKSGEVLVEGLRRRLADANGVWLVAGTGVLGHLPAADAVEEAMAEDWVMVEDWDFNPLDLKYFERRH